METSSNVAEAIRRTRGEVLAYGNEICDARFSKCCGGAMEEFQYCWDDTPKPYLKGIGDTPGEAIPDLTVEANAEQWIRSEPDSFCNTHDKRILSQVLNDYDQETTDFYRWRVDYTQRDWPNSSSARRVLTSVRLLTCNPSDGARAAGFMNCASWAQNVRW